MLGTGTLQATATLRDAANNVLTGRPVTWNAPSNPAVASVSATGLITGIAPGTTTITATSEGKTSPAITIRVLAGVNTVTVTAADSSIYVTQTQQATVVLKDASNNVLTGRPVTWTSSAPAVATVNATGLITAVSVGSATITVDVPAEGKSGTMPFTVSLVPTNTVTVSPAAPTLLNTDAQTFTAVLRDTANNVLTGRTVTWSSASAKFTINSGTGAGAAADTGVVVITGTTSPGTGVGNIATGTATVTINLVPIASVTVAPALATVVAGTMTSATFFTATVTDTKGVAFLPHGRSCTITTADQAKATVLVGAAESNTFTVLTDATGTMQFGVHAIVTLGGGTVDITVTCEGQSKVVPITIP